MTFDLSTRYTPATYHAKVVNGRLKATCTCGHEFAAKALAVKVINQVFSSGEMAFPVISSLKQVDEPKDHTAPVSWRLILKEDKK